MKSFTSQLTTTITTILLSLLLSTLTPGLLLADLIGPLPLDPSKERFLPTVELPSRTSLELYQARDMVWGMLTEDQDLLPTDSYVTAVNRPLKRLLETVPVYFTGVMPIEGREYLYFGIDADEYEKHDIKAFRRALERRFPALPVYIEAVEGISGGSGYRNSSVAKRVASAHVSQEALSFSDEPAFPIRDNTKTMEQGGTITIPGSETIDTLTVSVNIQHTYRSDLRVELVSPTGISVMLYDGVGKDDSSDNLIISRDVSEELQGRPAKGTWQLLVGDYVENDGGTLVSWGLSLTTTGTIRAPTLPIGGGNGPSANPDVVFFDDFERGSENWIAVSDRGDTGWRVTDLDAGYLIPGSDQRQNKVAQSDECDSECSFLLAVPLDLTGYSDLVLSFDRWLDRSLDRGEYLKVEIGKDGTYRELVTRSFDSGDADGQWHREVFALRADDIATAQFTVRFSSENSTYFEEVAVDNVRIATADASPEVPDITEAGPPYQSCGAVPERSSIMGGDLVVARHVASRFSRVTCGTLTVAGVKTDDNKEGIVTAAHTFDNAYQDSDFFVGHVFDTSVDGSVRRPIGKVEQMPFIYRGSRLHWVQRPTDPVVIGDAAFVEYPRLRECSLEWRVDGETYCFQNDYLQTAVPMTIRGSGDTTYRVVGARAPKTGELVMVSGALSGQSGPARVAYKLLNMTSRGIKQYLYGLPPQNMATREGDSGAPVYTEPNDDGEVMLVGVYIGEIISDVEHYKVFSPWNFVDEALGLKSL